MNAGYQFINFIKASNANNINDANFILNNYNKILSYNDEDKHFIMSKALEFAGIGGNIYLYKWLYGNQVCIELKSVEISFINACKGGYLDIIKYIIAKRLINSAIIEQAFLEAVENGHLHICKWLFTYKNTKVKIDITIQDNKAFILACKGGYIDICQWLFSLRLFQHKINLSAQNNLAYKLAVINGQMTITKWLFSLKHLGYRIDHDCNINLLFLETIINNHLEMGKWLVKTYQFKIDLTTSHTMKWISFNGNFAILQWLSTIVDCKDYYDEIYYYAIIKQNYEICNWILEKKK